MDDVVIIKREPSGEEKWRYTGKILARGAAWVQIEAYFNRDDLPFHGIILGRGDRFVETYYADRWFNIFEIHDRADDALKGWYCNITLPAEIRDGEISYIDLALDVLVYPDGRQLILDEDEFEALPLPEEWRTGALRAMGELQTLFRNGQIP